ncbi:MAG: Maf family protein [Mobilitalea sp.]
MYLIILASESPRRKEIMETMGIPYTVITSNVEEVVEETEPEKMVQALAELKTSAIEERLEKQEQYGLDFNKEDRIIIGADTMVFYQEHALGKPKDTKDALRILRMLSGNAHEVITGVSIIICKDGKKEKLSFAVSTKVIVQTLTDQQIVDYIATGEPMDKAGAYAIQGKFGIFIRKIDGDYYNVMGLPIAKIYSSLLHKDIDIKKLN